MPARTPNVYTFPRNEPGTNGHLDLVEPLRALPGQVESLLKGITETQAHYRPSEGERCIREIVGHLRDDAEVQNKRLYMMSTQTDPILEPYDPDEYAREHGYLERPLADMLAELRYYRIETVQLLTSLVNWNWARTGQHREQGRKSIRQTVEYMIAHEAEHLDEIRLLLAEAPVR